VVINVTLLSNKVKAECTYCDSYNYSVSTVLHSKAPASPVFPTVIIRLSSSFNRNCNNNNLSIDATLSYGNGGRQFINIEWTVVTKNAFDTSLITNYLKQFGEEEVLVMGNTPNEVGNWKNIYWKK
jgi:hypothetical protein